MSDNTAQRAPAYFFYLAQGHCHSTAGEACAHAAALLQRPPIQI